MPAIVNLLANIAFGTALVVMARRAPAMRGPILAWPLLVLVGFQALIVTPVTTFLFRFYPQWSMLYWFDPQLFPWLDGFVGPLSLAAVLANWGAALGAFFLARYGVSTGQRWATTGPLIASALGLLYLVISYGERLVFVGDYDEFWEGQAHVVFARLAGWLGLLAYGAGIIVLVTVRRRFAARDPQLL